MRISRALSNFLLVGCIVAVAVPCTFGQGGGERPTRGPGGGGPGGGGGGRGFGGGGMGGFGGGGGMAALVALKEVREELKVDETQAKELDTAAKEMAEEMRTQMGTLFGGAGRGAGGPGGGGAAGGGAAGGGAAGGASGGGTAGGRGAGGRGAGGPGGFDMEKMRAAMTELRNKSEDKLNDILDPIQMDRLVGLHIQKDGVRSFSSKTVSARLKITADQKAKVAALETSAAEETRAAMTPGADFREVMEKVRKESEEKTMAVLTATQKAEMEKMKGEKFEFPAQPARGGGRGNPAP